MSDPVLIMVTVVQPRRRVLRAPPNSIYGYMAAGLGAALVCSLVLPDAIALGVAVVAPLLFFAWHEQLGLYRAGDHVYLRNFIRRVDLGPYPQAKWRGSTLPRMTRATLYVRADAERPFIRASSVRFPWVPTKMFESERSAIDAKLGTLDVELLADDDFDPPVI